MITQYSLAKNDLLKAEVVSRALVALSLAKASLQVRVKEKNEKCGMCACVCVTDLGHFDVVLWGGLTQSSEVWVLGSAVWEQVAGSDRHSVK